MQDFEVPRSIKLIFLVVTMLFIFSMFINDRVVSIGCLIILVVLEVGVEILKAIKESNDKLV